MTSRFRLIFALVAAGLVACASPTSPAGPGTTDSGTTGSGTTDVVQATDANGAADAARTDDASQAGDTAASPDVADAGTSAGDTTAAKDCAQVSTTGVPPSSPVAAPTFASVLDHEGQSADPATLQGKWTVMWFYPAASTAG